MATVGSDATELKLHSCIGFTGESDSWHALTIRPHFSVDLQYDAISYSCYPCGHMRVVVHLGDRSWRVIVAAVGARLDVALYPSSESRLLHGEADERGYNVQQ